MRYWLKKIVSIIKIDKTERYIPLFKFFLILLLVFIVFGFYSYMPGPLKICHFELKQSGIKEFYSPSILPIGKLLVNTRDKTHIQPAQIDSTAQRFLLIGDSMLEGIGLRLMDYCKQNGHEMKSVIWYSSSTLWYGNCDTVSYFINEFKPTYVIIVLGGNELFIRDINSRNVFAKNILRQVGDKKYIWVGPPNWKDDTGINDLILRNVGVKRYFPSKNLTYERLRDGAHPTRKSASIWADSIAAFIMKKSMYPVLLNFPEKACGKLPSMTLLGPHPPKNL